MEEVNQQDVFCVEYIGSFPSEICCHGNSPTSESEYVRSKPEVIATVRDLTKTMQPKEAYQSMVLNNEETAPRNLKQVQNIKYSSNNSDHDKSGSRKNFADDFQALLNMMPDSKFIQEVFQTRGKPPCVLLYESTQIQDMERLASNNNSGFVIGVDRTFNLGPCFLTLLVFSNQDLVRKGTDTSPLILGPLFLHSDASYETYHKLFSHLRCKLGSISKTTVTKTVFGSDEEKALTKALRQCFPESVHTLCTRHLEQNIGRYLEKVGVKLRSKLKIIADIFGSGGLLQSSNEEQFDLKFFEILDDFTQKSEEFARYFEKNERQLERICIHSVIASSGSISMEK